MDAVTPTTTGSQPMMLGLQFAHRELLMTNKEGWDLPFTRHCLEEICE